MENAPASLDFALGMPSPDQVRQLEAALVQLPQVDLLTEQLAHGGIAARTIFIPAGTVLTGALTNLDNVCIVCGDITVTTDDGPIRLTGFNVVPAKAGAKRVGVAHADTYWSCLWRTELSDVADIELEMTDEADGLLSRKMLAASKQQKQIEESKS